MQIIRRAGQNSLVLSIDRVKLELERGKDELAEWANGSFQFDLPEIDRLLGKIR